MTRTFSCVQCGAPGEAGTSGPVPTYCGRACRRAANRNTTRRYSANYRATHKAEAAAYVRRRKASDLQFRLACALRKRAGRALSGTSRAGSAVRDLGCSVVEFRAHLEDQFRPGMSWENWGRDGWHIDHVKPLASFDLTDRTQFLQACHYSNLQPLWRAENQTKGDRF